MNMQTATAGKKGPRSSLKQGFDQTGLGAQESDWNAFVGALLSFLFCFFVKQGLSSYFARFDAFFLPGEPASTKQWLMQPHTQYTGQAEEASPMQRS